MREVEAEVAQLVGWGSEEAGHRRSNTLVLPFFVGQSSRCLVEHDSFR